MPCTDDEVVSTMREVEEARRQLEAVARKLAAEAEVRSLPQKAGVGKLSRFLAETLHLGRGEALARANAVQVLAAKTDPSGGERPVELAWTASAQECGFISEAHVRAIVKIMGRIPGSVNADDRAIAESQLVHLAVQTGPDALPKAGEHLLAYLDPDGKRSSEEDRARMRGVSLGAQRADGMRPISGLITPALSAVLDPYLAKAARPGMCNPDDPQSPWVADENLNPETVEAAAQRDRRSTAQRTHDALLALLRPDLGPAQFGHHRGLPVSTIFTMTVAELEAAAGVTTTASGGTISIPEALRLAEQAIPFLALFDHSGRPLHLGRAKKNRLASPDQRMALIAAEKGCSRPGCTAPATMAAVHHVTEWSKGGATDIENLTLACDSCHALVHDGPGGWKTVVLGPESETPGRIGWIAPSHIDPTGTPRINESHHAPELLARSLARARHERLRQIHQC
ncbi:HNH endonuclease signature motif containing protein [Nocardia sp. CDC153]|uniref:HNH endonuclease signature motif containing protein n=1 Tax=Nocardia sp. CDC153 TaxID=3112167 RepID=UPI002DBD4272|nr:DUF222 domain-containing protein [Nocardia sp. CDC153]